MVELIVKSGVRDKLEDNSLSRNFYRALDEEVEELLEEAAHRAEANDRKTVMPKDL